MSELPAVDPVPVEARPYQGMRAGVVSRTIAATVDFLIVIGVIVGCFVGYLAFRFLLNPVAFTFPDVSFLRFLVAYGIVLFLYLSVSWGTSGRTYGNHIMGLRVVNFRGRKLRVPGAVLRAAFYTVFPIGLFWCAVSKQNRSFQDMTLRTSVIYDWTHRDAARGVQPHPLGAVEPDVTSTQPASLPDPGSA
jgi:uncharacterized RDD family membrane protein YckC